MHQIAFYYHSTATGFHELKKRGICNVRAGSGATFSILPAHVGFAPKSDRKPYMSANLSRPFRTAQVISFCSAPFGAHPSVRTRGLSRPSRTGPVKDGRRADPATLRLISRPLLDWPEHDGGLGRVGSRAHRACPQQIEHPRHTASTRRISNNSRLPWLPVVKARSAGQASMSMGSCDDRITLYPAAPLRLATLLHARTIAREDGAHLHNGRLARPTLRWFSPATHPTHPTPTRRSVGTVRLSSLRSLSLAG